MDLEPLNIERLRDAIASLTVPSQLVYFPDVGSTNRVATTLPDPSFHPGTVVMTEYQSAGRGRRGRVWVAPPRTALLLSLILPAPSVPNDALLLVALSVTDSIRALGAPAEIKWPNDILIGERKVCGILAERVTRDGRDVVIVGCGLNVLAHPDLPGAGSVADALGRPVDRTELAADMFKYVDLWYRSLSERPEVLYETWVERLQTVGREVVVFDGAESWTGVAAGVEREGGLRVRQSGGAERLVLAGDVSIRNVGDFTTT